MRRVLLEKAAAEPANSQHYRELLLADAIYCAVLENGLRPTDRTHGELFGPQSAG
jgi:hypothetical protein